MTKLPQIETLHDDDGDPWGYVARGTHTPSDFVAALATTLGVTAVEDEVRHDRWAYVPPTRQHPRGHFMRGARTRPGSFPVTYVEY